MPRNRRMMDYAMSRGRDMRNPYGSRGGYVSSRRARRDGLMMEDMRRYNRGEGDYDLAEMTRQNQEIMHDPYMPRDYARGGRGRDRARGGDRAGDYGTGEPYAGVDDFYEQNDMARGRRDYAEDYARGRRDMAGRDYGEYGDMARGGRGGRDGHYGRGEMYYPIEAMGYFSGYYGGGDYGMDHARGGRGRRTRDYAVDYGRDYGESEYLEDEDLEEWAEKLKKEVEEKDKAFFSKENLKKKAQEMGIKFDKFTFEEFMVTALMMYTDYCKTLGTANMNTYLSLAKDWLSDEDIGVKYGEKLAAYYDNIVDPE